MVYCSCGKPMERVPDWLAGVLVEFVCNNCPNRKVRNIASVTFEPEVAQAAKLGPEEATAEEDEAEAADE